ncbi:MAG: hypothetical protein J6S71_06890 [Clostridia bacterium]|nr:hypothetical protein [Clostridia bacterium]
MLSELFTRCLNATYIHTENCGDYAIELDGDTLYLLFECSDGAEDWRNNFDFPARPYKRMEDEWFCHRGFLKVWKAMRDEIERTVDNLLEPEIKNIVCVGYSHGGPLALLATEDMEYLHGDKVMVTGYGFGSPRVIWGNVPEAVKNRLQRFKVIRNVPDLVTHVPPALLGFRHGGEVVNIGSPGKYGPIKAHYASAYKNELSQD